jgi:hypothetical protein
MKTSSFDPNRQLLVDAIGGVSFDETSNIKNPSAAA